MNKRDKKVNSNAAQFSLFGRGLRGSKITAMFLVLLAVNFAAQGQIQNNSATTAEDVKQSYIEARAKFDTPDTRICKKCETHIDNVNATRCFYCGAMLGADEDPDQSTQIVVPDGATPVESTLKGKFYVVSAEQNGQDVMAELEVLAELMGTTLAELCNIEFLGDGRVKVTMMGMEFEDSYKTVDNVTVATDTKVRTEFWMKDDKVIMLGEDGSVMVLSNTIPK